MKRLHILFYPILLLLLSVSYCSYAQSAGDIELAKQLARQKGYSESQIEEILNKQQSGMASSPSSRKKSEAVDRNAAVANAVVAENDLPYNTIPEDAYIQNDSTAVFGHYLFRSENLSFVPSYNIPTPENYKLSAGDELVIDLWGDVVKNISVEVSPEGSVYIPDLGPVYVYGYTVKQAEKMLKRYMAKIHSGLEGDEPDTFMNLSLGKIKSVTVNVVGDVMKPGTYTLPSLSSVVSVLYMAGGPDKLGSIREIKLYRNNRTVSVLDMYDYLMNGKAGADIKLEDNDAVMVVPYKNMVTLSGAVKRPMLYEMKDGETLADLFRYGGGFAANAYPGAVQVDRRKTDGVADGPASEIFNVKAGEFASFELKDGDKISVSSVNERFANKVSIEGAVWRPGEYSLDDNIGTLKQLIINVGGLRDDAYLERAYIERLGKERNKEQVSFSLKDVILGASDIELKPDDHVRIFSLSELNPDQMVIIDGEVNNPGEYEYRKGMTLGDIILKANGPTKAATLERVEVARRISNLGEPESVENISDTIALVLSYNLLKNPGDVDVKLEPFDMVFVRRSLYYKPQEGIKIEGEVNYPGTYVVEKNTVRLSDIVARADGFNKDAYVKGAKLTRVLTEEELERLHIAMDIAKKQTEDSLDFDMMDIGDRYTIAIDLEQAVANPGTDADIVLRKNDIITVPKYNNTVKISGGVLKPNTVAYAKGEGFKHYINSSGGYLKESMRRKVYMVHMNGDVASKGSAKFKVQPGTEIVVPVKEKRDSQTMATVLSMATSVTSIAAMVATIVNLTK